MHRLTSTLSVCMFGLAVITSQGFAAVTPSIPAEFTVGGADTRVSPLVPQAAGPRSPSRLACWMDDGYGRTSPC
jgi:hypothetical protein